MKENSIKEKSYKFAVRIVRMYQTVTKRNKEYVLSQQCLRSGTAVGALVFESEHAQSTADFISKLNIALKEANETLYWLMLMKDTGYLMGREFDTLFKDAAELVKIIVSILKTLKGKK